MPKIISLIASLALLAGVLSILSCSNTDAGEYLPQCQGGKDLGVVDLSKAIGAPGECGQKMSGEGLLALVRGKVDPSNIVDKRDLPQLPYEKFLLLDETRGANLDVRVRLADSAAFFDRLKKLAAKGQPVVVRGIVSGVDMHLMGGCKRGMTLVVDQDDAIEPAK